MAQEFVYHLSRAVTSDKTLTVNCATADCEEPNAEAMQKVYLVHFPEVMAYLNGKQMTFSSDYSPTENNLHVSFISKYFVYKDKRFEDTKCN